MRNQRTYVLLTLSLMVLLGLLLAEGLTARGADLAKDFASPPASARPWVYWFWLNGNITREGITADLEAMRRVGVGGVLIMEVDQGTPKGAAAFAGTKWRDLFKFMLSEAKRLGIEVNMNNDAGWCGSGGPWITPSLAMQKVTWTTTNVEGPRRFEAVLAAPEKVANYYQDIAVFAFPTPAEYRIEGIQAKAAFVRQEVAFKPLPEPLPREKTIPRSGVRNISGEMRTGGRLVWDVPPGKWTILRLGHTPTGKDNHPAPEAGRGLECDKLSKAGADAMFAGLMGKILSDSKSLAGETLVATHIDSWEVGSQNWTAGFLDEFKRLRGYDALPFLPVMTGVVVDNLEVSERFLWDLRMTISDLTVRNYAGRFRELARQNGLRLSIEAYDGCCDDMTYAGQADEPMGEFWSWRFGVGAEWCTEMASAAHTYGRPILGAEAFTATDKEKWLGHPGNIKALGDWAFCEGVNRFVFHRYALQPWKDVKPGMSMGPWGLHYERTSTWWEQSRAWHEYLSRCQFVLQQGQFVADICYLAPEASPGKFHAPRLPGSPPHRPGYNFDGCTPELVLQEMKVKDGQLVLPSGMRYRLLVLPEVETMTPQLLRKVRELVKAGATVVGPPPLRSPSLTDYPRCDEEVRALTRELWPGGAGQGGALRGKGRMIWPIENAAAAASVEPSARLGAAKWIWFKEGRPAASAPVGERYFRRVFNIADASQVQSARLVITADNQFEAWLNGERLGEGEDFSHTYLLDGTRRVKSGDNLLTVKAVNGANLPNPAGFTANLVVKYRDGRSEELRTDRTWQAARTVAGQWRNDLETGTAWQPALELGSVGMAPWGDIDHAPGEGPAMYPSIEAIAKVMKQMGVAPDFDYVTQSGERDLRYIHKRIGKLDVYFVSNEKPQAEQALCSFRVKDKRPELWWPDGGQIDQAAVYEQVYDCVRMPIRLDPSGSVFVVFRPGADRERSRITTVMSNGETLLDIVKEELGSSAVKELGIELSVGKGGALEAQVWKPGTYTLTSAGGKTQHVQAPTLPEPVEIAGPWQVKFAPGGGAPESVTFDQLTSWSEHADSGVKYFSGAATYTKQLDVKPDLFGPGRRFYLDLGKVEVMAQVKLNGRNLGVLWKAPYGVEVTDALKPGANTLEITVVNLWPNRQIGDEQLPEDSDRNPNGTLKEWPKWLQEGKPSPTGRYTFTSWRLWKKDSPLVESGLLGPVKLHATQKVVLLR